MRFLSISFTIVDMVSNAKNVHCSCGPTAFLAWPLSFLLSSLFSLGSRVSPRLSSLVARGSSVQYLRAEKKIGYCCHDSLPEWSKGVDSSSTSASCVGSNPTAVICTNEYMGWACLLVCFPNSSSRKRMHLSCSQHVLNWCF